MTGWTSTMKQREFGDSRLTK